jgi:hypothetical protein
VNQILRDKPEKILPIVRGGVDAENLVKPETRCRQIPKSEHRVNKTN